MKLLLHVCCGPCSTYVINLLKKDYDLELFFFNPNIEPKEEYEKRLKEVKKYSKKLNVPLHIGKYENDKWRESVKGHENDPEGGERCSICTRVKFERTARFADENNFDIFATTLTISIYKPAKKINKIGNKIAKKFDIEYLDSDFKQDHGFEKSCKLSKKNNMYRQTYCGCSFSKDEH